MVTLNLVLWHLSWLGRERNIWSFAVLLLQKSGVDNSKDNCVGRCRCTRGLSTQVTSDEFVIGTHNVIPLNFIVCFGGFVSVMNPLHRFWTSKGWHKCDLVIPFSFSNSWVSTYSFHHLHQCHLILSQNDWSHYWWHQCWWHYEMKKKNSIVVNSNPIVAHSAQFSHYTVRQYCLARIFCSPLIKLKGIHENPTEDLLYTPTFKNIIIIVSLNNAATITQKHSRDCCCLIQQMDFWANKQSPEKIVWNVELYSDSGAFRVKLHLWQTSLLADGKKITTSAPVW